MLLAKTSGLNFSQLIREGAEEVKKKRAKTQKKRDWKKFIGAGGRGGPKDLSSKIDYYLYGEGNPKWAGR
ncbi:MAG: hypothetical protein UY06_C0032G0011 [Candidatus Amesbacteria bacterium GW2011_GWA2_47_70]|nr:MAG: hypothetical protein UY06_C0032G0011 [Candidatus Amesbacteria bacterium GW2011_GWA2_47_70]